MSAPAPRSRRRPFAIVVVVALLLVAGYFVTMHFVRAHVDGLIAKSEGNRLPEFDLPTVSGGRVRSADFAGKRVFLNFFRSRCHSCDAEAEAMRAFAAEVRDRTDVVVVSVLLDEVMGFAPSDSTATLMRHGYTHAVAIADRAFVDAFHGAGWANVTPVTYVADASGRIRHALRGTRTLASLRAALE